MYFDSPKPLSQKSWKPPEIRKHEIELSGQINVIGLWDGVAQFHLIMNANRPAESFGLRSSISALFRFTCQSIHCIGEEGLRVGRNIYNALDEAPNKLPDSRRNAILENWALS